MNNDNFERVCAEAVSCSRCFPAAGAARAFVDIAQPRYVGAKYWKSTDRRLFLMINPGAGNGSASDRAMRSAILSYRDGELSLEDLFERQRTRFPDWGLRFVASPHYAASFVIDFDAIRNLVRECHEYGDLQ